MVRTTFSVAPAATGTLANALSSRVCALDRRAGEADVHLDDLAAVPLAGVGHRNAHLDALVRGRRGRLPVGEGRVRQAEAERVRHLLLARVEAPVADVQALAVADVPVLAGEVQVGGVVLEAERDRLGQPPRRVDPAEEHVGDRAAARLAKQPALDDRGHRGVPRGGAEHGPVGQDHDGARVSLRDLLDQRPVRVGQVDAVPVGALGLVHAADEDQRDVARLRERHRLGEQVPVLGRLAPHAIGSRDAFLRRALADQVAGREAAPPPPSRR